jgi:hypothetical protein
MPLPGIVQYFVNDLHGRPLLVVTEDVRGNLAKSLPSVIAAVRKNREHLRVATHPDARKR